MAKDKAPTNKEWAALYEAAVAFKQAACWEWMDDNDLFGVQDPESGEMAYCCIMGAGGEHYGIAGYLGAEGLAGMRGLSSLESTDPSEILSLQKCLMCSFEDRALLRPEDLNVTKELGCKFRGKNQWPLFRHYEPGYVPWFITGKQCRFLTHILRQALEVSLRCREDKGILNEGGMHDYLVRISIETASGELVWEDEYDEAPDFEQSYLTLALDNEVLISKLASMKTNKQQRFEFDAFYTSHPVAGKPRPFFPKICVLVDRRSGVVLRHDTIIDLQTQGDRAVAMLLSFIEDTGEKPAALYVAREEVYQLFEAVCEQIKIRIELVDRLDAIDHLRRVMRESGF